MQAATGLTAPVSHLVERLAGPLFLASREPVRPDRSFVRFDVNKPGPAQQKQLWQKSLADAAAQLNGTLDEISEQFRLSARTIFAAGQLATAGGDNPDSCRHCGIRAVSLARPQLEDMAQRIVPCATWDDLILPELQKQTLRQLAAQVRHRMTGL